MGLLDDDLDKVAVICLCSLLVAGCGSVPTAGERRVSITSKPSGARVSASGAEIGTTPLTIRPDEVFPPRFVGFDYRAAGTLSVAKPGCRTHRQPVDDAVLSKDVHVVLACDPTASSPAPPAELDAGQSIAARLQRAERLRERGLITVEEYRRARARILDEL